MRAAQQQAIIQQQIIQHQWQQQQEQQHPQQFGGGFAPGFQPAPQGYNGVNYTSIYWNQTGDQTDSGPRPGSDLPPAYSSVNLQTNPPPYPAENKY